MNTGVLPRLYMCMIITYTMREVGTCLQAASAQQPGGTADDHAVPALGSHCTPVLAAAPSDT